MAQLIFHNTFCVSPSQIRITASNGTISFFPIWPSDSISWATFNFLAVVGSNATFTLNIGLYSLTGSSLSIANSISGSIAGTIAAQEKWINLTATSATQNITPGNWYLGFLCLTSSNSDFRLDAISINPNNAFPGGFIGGRMTESTNVLPSSYATSDLDITGSDAMSIPFIILTA